jgi:hypothetical protein
MIAEPTTRFKDTRKRIESFDAKVLIGCPDCGKCASLMTDLIKPREQECSCFECGYSERRINPQFSACSNSGGLPPLKHIDLWLQTSCCGNILWALNEEPLTFLKGYVSAKLRQRQPIEFGWSNQSLFGRLPRWLTSAKNRDEVQRGIGRLKLQLPSR